MAGKLVLFTLFCAVLFTKLWAISAVSLDITHVFGIAETKSTEKEDEFSAAVTFSFASYYGDHMVLQKSPKRANIWGYHPKVGADITLKIAASKYTAVVSANHVWSVTLGPVSNPGPYVISASSLNETIVLKDVLFGDVWVCSGQSNMEFTVSMLINASAEIEEANNFPHIRLFTVKQVSSNVPWEDFHKGSIMEPWSVASNVSVSGSGKLWTYFSAVCWLYGKYLHKHLGYPVGLVASDWGGTPVESWSSPDALDKCKKDGQQSGERMIFKKADLGRDLGTGPKPSTPSVLWNAMIYPLLNMTIYGVIWYQGEANAVSNPHTYNCTFPAMINDWRDKWFLGSNNQTDQVLPFGFVQLAPWTPTRVSMGFPELRWHQTADFGYVPNKLMPKTFMAVAVDLPDFLSPYTGIHPRDKQDVASRLVLGGLAVAYQQKQVLYQGPLPNMFVVDTSKSSLQVIYQEDLVVNNNVGFEIRCFVGGEVITDKNSWWLKAPVAKNSGKSLTLLTNSCPADKVMGVRYDWKLSPCMFKNCAVYSKVTSLPAVPFQFTSEKFNETGSLVIDMTEPHPLESYN